MLGPVREHEAAAPALKRRQPAQRVPLPPNYDSYARRHEAGSAPVVCAAPNRAVRWTMHLGARLRTVARVIDKEKSAQSGDRTLAQPMFVTCLS